MTIGLSVKLRNARLNLIRDAIDADVNPGLLRIYTGTRPATGAAITDQVLLGTCVFSATSAPNATAGMLTFNAITSDPEADASGVATWARALDGAGVFVMDMSITDDAGDGDIKMNSTTIIAGSPISVTSGLIIAGNA